MQRTVDIVLSGIALLLLAPLFLLVVCVLKVTGEGEIFSPQSRVGRGGKHFKLYKFATMLKDSPNMGTGTVTVKDDPRILPIGRVLRKTKINELPQLLNVFKGDMSIIGPRPQTQRCFDAFPLSSQNQIIKVRPGLSGIGSVIFRNEEEMMHANEDPNKFYDDIVMPYKGLLEEWYVSRCNFSTYFGLIALTAWVILRPDSSFVWRFYQDLPVPPDSLKRSMNYFF